MLAVGRQRRTGASPFGWVGSGNNTETFVRATARIGVADITTVRTANNNNVVASIIVVSCPLLVAIGCCRGCCFAYFGVLLRSE